MKSWRPTAALLPLLLVVAGCVSISERLAGSLSGAIQRQTDIETVRDGAPAYLLMIDGLIDDDPQNAQLLLSGARLYGSYAAAFVDDPERTQRLAQRAKNYAGRALCIELADVCASTGARFDVYTRVLQGVDEDETWVLFGYGVTWAGWLQANSSDWNAIADVPKVRATMRRVVELDEQHEQGAAFLYLGVLATLLPPALGGEPEKGRRYFERAIEISRDRNLMAYVLFAEHYARLVFDRELHDELLSNVVDREIENDEFALNNTLAKARAKALLASGDEYF
ncbi:MAG: TRAP transporter TatT component family protein [Gammaproteobacteria bacterium]|nr:TRAP transporter TatT component family protein [Gammaproteobacteria bacterium]